VRKKFGFLVLALLLLLPWPVAYAYDNGVAGSGSALIEVAESEAAPSWNVFGKAIGGVSQPIDLFYVDALDSPADMQVTLYLTNVEGLGRCYRYLTLKVGVYVESNPGQWEEVADGHGGRLPDTYITLLNGQVSFTLPGYARHKVTIDRGCFYCIRTDADGGSLSPQFYLTVD